MIEKVWLLWFERERDEGDDTELLIGVYRSEDAAKEAIERVKVQPGFRDFAQGFSIYETVLDKDNWTDGFVRL